jgi:hypothetical protein
MSNNSVNVTSIWYKQIKKEIFMTNQEPKWQPLSMIKTFLTISKQNLEASRKQVANMKKIQNLGYSTLSNAELERIIKAHEESNNFAKLYLVQCEKWSLESLYKEQQNDIITIKEYSLEQINLNNSILKIAKQCLQEWAST